MVIKIICERHEKNWYGTRQKLEMWKINEPDIKFCPSERDRQFIHKDKDGYLVDITNGPQERVTSFDLTENVDIHYWVGHFRNENKNVINIVYLYHPHEPDWTDAKNHADFIVHHCHRYGDTFDFKDKAVIPGVIDLDLFTPRKLNIGVIAWKHKKKNPELLHQFLYKAPKELLDKFCLTVNGPGWQDDIPIFNKYIETTYNEHELYSDMPNRYRHLDYVLVFSHPWGESGPCCIVEGLGMNVPVISTNVGYVGELKVDHVFSTADELIKIFDNIANSRRKQILGYSWDNFRKEHIKLFREIYAGRKRILR